MLPAVAVMVVVADQDHHAVFAVVNGVIVRLMTVLLIIVTGIIRLAGAEKIVHARYLRRGAKTKDGVKDRMVNRDFLRLAIGKDALHLPVTVLPLRIGPK